MLGITIPDAVLIGTLVVSLLAAWRGTRAGEAAKAVEPPEPIVAMIGSAIVDSATLRDLVESVNRLAEVIEHATDKAEHRKTGRPTELLEEISEKIEKRPRGPHR